MKPYQLKKSHIAAAVMMTLSAQAIQAADNKEQVLPSITVTGAAGYEQEIIDAPASISVVTREELEKKSYTTIMDAIKNVPGVSTAGGGNNQEINIRGMGSGYTLYLIDGKPLSTARNISTNGTDVGKYQSALPPVSMIERVEIIRGPMSSLYGSEAMGGVINIITRKYSNEWQGTISTEYTQSDNKISSNSQQTDVFASGPLVEGLLGLQVNAAYYGQDESTYLGGEANKSDASRPDSKQKKVGAKLILTPNADNDIALSFDTSNRDDKYTKGISSTTDSNYELKKSRAVLEHTGRYGDLHITSYLQRERSDNVRQADKKQETVTTVNNQTTYYAGNNTFTFGGQYKKEQLINDSNQMLVIKDPAAVREMDRWLAAVFAEAEWKLTDKLSLTTGARYNRDQKFGGHLTPRLYAVYHSTDNLTIKGGVSTGYKQPKITDVTPGFALSTGKGKAVIIANPNLKPEKSTSAELGFNYDKREYGFSTGMTVFHTEFKDKIAEYRLCQSPAVCTTFGKTYTFISENRNIDKAMMQGVEFSLGQKLGDRVTFNANYTYTKSEQKSGKFKGSPLNKIPEHMFNANIDWQATDTVSAWTQFNYRGKASEYLGRDVIEAATPGYGFVDIGFVAKVNKNMSIKGGVYNVANKVITKENFDVILDGRRYNIGMNVNF